MKYIKQILLIGALLAAWSPAAFAQNDATTTASANVLAGLDVSGFELKFENIVTGTSKFLDADGLTVTSGGVTGGEQFGTVKIEYAEGQSVDVAITFPKQLKKVGDVNTTLDVDNSADGNGGSGANAVLAYKDTGTNTFITGDVEESDIIYLNGGGKADWVDGPNNADFDNYFINDVTIPTTGKLYVVIGGKVTASQTQDKAEYEGTITVSATISN